jgi:tRNA1(Val) A37 N6-methylase TrmN6
VIRSGDSAAFRKERGAFFTPPEIADYLADWAVGADPNARILDPTCGEAVFLRSAGRRLRILGGSFDDQLFGVELHQTSLDWAASILESDSLSARLLKSDFFDVVPPGQPGSVLPAMDAVIGNPPFVRYHRHVGDARAKSRQAALRQNVRLSGQASSWAALLVHACGFLKPDGRLAMVLPAELLTVGYAEPIRAWLRQRFEQVHLVLFDQLQFKDATAKVVLVLASGSGGCDALSVYSLDGAADLARVRPMTNLSVTPASSGKWTDLLLPNRQRMLFKNVTASYFCALSAYGRLELGTVTGANHYFTMSETTRRRYGLVEDSHVVKVCPPGTKHLQGFAFTSARWAALRDAGERVWMLYPSAESAALSAYLEVGRGQGVEQAYKCKVRTPWWRPPMAGVPDLFFTYMSHRYPRLISNDAGTTYVNSMHGLRLAVDAPDSAKAALPLLTMNSVSLLGAEIYGRSYGGGILKMEPSEASVLPVPDPGALTRAWALLEPHRSVLEEWLVAGRWSEVVEQVDDVLLRSVLGLGVAEVRELQAAVGNLRARRVQLPGAGAGDGSGSGSGSGLVAV